MARYDGGSGADIHGGTNESDLIFGNGGNDVLSGSAGDDRIDGGDGNDILLSGTGFDDVDGGSGNDTLSYRNARGPIAVVGLYNVDFYGDRWDYSIDKEGDGEAEDYLYSTERLLGSRFDDQISGNQVIISSTTTSTR